MPDSNKTIYICSTAIVLALGSIICILAIQPQIENQMFDATAGFLVFLLPITFGAWSIARTWLRFCGRVAAVAYLWGAAKYLSTEYDCGFLTARSCQTPSIARLLAGISVALFIICQLLLFIRRKRFTTERTVDEY